jgi:hypothetical protein
LKAIAIKQGFELTPEKGQKSYYYLLLVPVLSNIKALSIKAMIFRLYY